MLVLVFSALPSFCRVSRVFIMSPSYLVGGRSLAWSRISGLSVCRVS
jgi:hypothetical protein